MMNDEQRELAVQNLRLVGFTMKKYFHIPKEETEDFMSIGYLALCKAAMLYDPQKGKFSTYAVRAIRVEFMSEFRKRTFASHCNPYGNVSYDQLAENHKGMNLLERIDDPSTEFESSVTTALLLSKMSQTERRIIKLRSKGMNQMEIGSAVGFSQAQISRILSRIKCKLKEA